MTFLTRDEAASGLLGTGEWRKGGGNANLNRAVNSKDECWIFRLDFSSWKIYSSDFNSFNILKYQNSDAANGQMHSSEWNTKSRMKSFD